MRLLFEIDKKDYSQCKRTVIRNSARSIIIKNNEIAMIHSVKYDYYKFPGGGIENGEDPIDAMIRETREEAGLVVIPETIKEYGMVHRIQKGNLNEDECFIQDNYYYLCDALDGIYSQKLDDYEAEEQFQLEYVDPYFAIKKNINVAEPRKRIMLDREIRVLELLINDGFIK